MSEPFLAEVRIWANTYVPRGWAYCNGQLINISQYTALFSVVGTLYGGDGYNSFALPNLAGRAAMGQGQGPGLTTRRVGDVVGQSRVTVTQSEMPPHSHDAIANDAPGGTAAPAGDYLAQGQTTSGRGSHDRPIYNGSANASMYPDTVSLTGGNEAHENMQPFLAVNFCMALDGLYPSRS